jgi:outer membrane lipoprotein-sorting protein
MRFASLIIAFGALLLVSCSASGGDATATPAGSATAVSTPASATATSVPGSEGAAPSWSSFHIEAKVTIHSDAATAGTNVSPTPTNAALNTNVDISWWSKSLQEFRQELNVMPEGQAANETQVVGTGGEIVIYDSGTNSYSTNTYPDAGSNLVAVPIPASIVLGPPSTPNFDAPFDGTMAMLQSLTNRPEGLVEKGPETVAGRPTRVFETGPATCGGTDAQSGAPTDCRGTVTIWVDTETGFILRYEAEDPGIQQVSVEVTTIEYSPDFASGLFQFSPPAGATERTP